MSTQNEKINNQLKKLACINEDACEFYESAQEKVESEKLKTTFRDLENLHKNIVINLQQQIRSNGGNSNDIDETIMGEAREFWTNLMTHISNDVDKTLVKNLEEAEDRCLHSMEKTMKNDDIPAETKMVLRNGYQALQKSHDYMKALKDYMKAA